MMLKVVTMTQRSKVTKKAPRRGSTTVAADVSLVCITNSVQLMPPVVMPDQPCTFLHHVTQHFAGSCLRVPAHVLYVCVP